MSWSEQTADALATFYCNEPFARNFLERAHNADNDIVRLHYLIQAKQRLMKLLAPIETAQLAIMKVQASDATKVFDYWAR